jgi:hypothetical protein
MTKADTMPKINKAIRTIEKSQLLFYQANQDFDRLSMFRKQNRTQLLKEGFHVFVDAEGLMGEEYFSHRKALREFLHVYKAMLEYARDNFDGIMQAQKTQTDIYKQLHLKYSNALEVNNAAYFRREKFINQYISEHPALAESIAKARQDFREE